MIVTKSEFKEMFEYKDWSSVSHLIRKKTIVANKEEMIDLDDKINKEFIKKRKLKLAQKSGLKLDNIDITDICSDEIKAIEEKIRLYIAHRTLMAENKTKNYTAMSNCHLFEESLSLKAKGLMSLFLALPDEFKFSIENIVSLSKESHDCIKSTLKELKESGYIKIEKNAPNKSNCGRFEYIYQIFEEKQSV